MSDNPFSSPTTTEFDQSKDYAHTNQRPGALTAILIICLVLGVMGFLGSLAGAAGLLMQASFSGMQGQTNEFNDQMQQIQSEQFVPSLIQIVLNFLIAPLLAVAAIGGLARKQWAYGLLKAALLIAAIYVGIRAILTTIVQISMMGRMSDMMESAVQQQSGQNAQGAEVASGVMQVGIIFGMVIAAGWAIVLIAFYIGSWLYVKKDTVKTHFGIDAK